MALQIPDALLVSSICWQDSRVRNDAANAAGRPYAAPVKAERARSLGVRALPEFI